MGNKIDFLELATNIQDELIELRRDFHKNPELGFEEHRTSKKIKEFLEEQGIEYKEFAKTGIAALIKGKGNKTIGIRADMDALPLKDKKICEYTSIVEGKMHACGHDGHLAILLGVAKLLNENKDILKGNIKLIFEPAEETVGGARFMIKEGVLENPKVDAVIGLHVCENIECGKIGIKYDEIHAASNPFTIKIIGKGGHGAHPNTTIDPIVIASNVIVSLQTIVSREIPPTDPVVITVGSIHGGTAQNIIPEEVVISGVIRTLRKEHRAYVVKRLTEVVQGIVTAMRGKCEINIEESYPCLFNNNDMVFKLNEVSSSVIGKENVIWLQNPSMGVESFSYFTMERPSVFYFLGVKNEEKGIIHPAHNSLFDIDEDALKIGVAIQCEMAVKLLED